MLRIGNVGNYNYDTNNVNLQKQNKNVSFGMKAETALEIVNGLYNNGFIQQKNMVSDFIKAPKEKKIALCEYIIGFFGNPEHQCKQPNCLYEATRALMKQLTRHEYDIAPHKPQNEIISSAFDELTSHLFKMTDHFSKKFLIVDDEIAMYAENPAHSKHFQRIQDEINTSFGKLEKYPDYPEKTGLHVVK